MGIVRLKLLKDLDGDYGDVVLGLVGHINGNHMMGLQDGAASYELCLFNKIRPIENETYQREMVRGNFQEILWRDDEGVKYRTIPTLTSYLTLKGFRDFVYCSDTVEDFKRKGSALSEFLGFDIYYPTSPIA